MWLFLVGSLCLRITAIVDALKTQDVVALGEGNHNNDQGAAFRNKLYGG